ncbi:MAG: LacI family transcriptional regulator [Candidatus Omnitrophica bacterium]|nr:LacI family transcriptional regulator [Candidatus Omnitrophota bacterium]
MIRLKDIAQRAGVSVMTVSKVLRDAPDISAITKARIRTLAQQMGYVPDSLAQGLRTRKSKLLGLVVSAITNPIFVRLVLAIEERAFETGYDVIIAHSLNQPEREEMVIHRLLSRRVDGLLIAPVYRLTPAAPVYTELLKRDVPTVIIGHHAPFCSQFVSVETDDLQASYAVTQHLIGLKHRCIAFFTGPPVCPWAQERLDGYRRALREAGLEVDDRLIFNAGATIEEGEKAARQMLSESPKVTAVQAVNDLVAMGAANVLLDSGLQIPRDISVAGFGNFLASEFYRVPLTTIRQPKYRLGTAAMVVLMKLLGGDRPDSVRLPATMVVRGSTGSPAPPTVG